MISVNEICSSFPFGLLLFPLPLDVSFVFCPSEDISSSWGCAIRLHNIEIFLSKPLYLLAGLSTIFFEDSIDDNLKTSSSKSVLIINDFFGKSSDDFPADLRSKLPSILRHESARFFIFLS